MILFHKLWRKAVHLPSSPMLKSLGVNLAFASMCWYRVWSLRGSGVNQFSVHINRDLQLREKQTSELSNKQKHSWTIDEYFCFLSPYSHTWHQTPQRVRAKPANFYLLILFIIKNGLSAIIKQVGLWICHHTEVSISTLGWLSQQLITLAKTIGVLVPYS